MAAFPVQPRSRKVPGAHGTELHLLEWSEEGTPLLLLHGFGMDAHAWDDFAPAVAPHYRTLAMDLRGHGDSGHDPERRYAYADHVADVLAVCETLGLERLVLMGHSFGGRVSMLFAGAHPERMAGLVIVDAGPELDDRGVGRILGEVASRPADASFDSVEAFARIVAGNFPAASGAQVERIARYALRRRADGRYEPKLDPAYREFGAGESAAERVARERATTKSLWDALGRVPCPALVVRGAASDILSPDTAERMAEEVLPKGRLAVVPRAAHSVMIDNPEGFRDAVCAFVLGDG